MNTRKERRAGFYVLTAWTCLILISMTVVACMYPFREAKIQVICRAYPAHYGAWQYAPAGQMDSQQRWVDNCNDAELFHKAYALIWEDFSSDSTVWCVECSELPDCPDDFKQCP